ncbi:universal stress protein [Micromonospora echinofusca]|uniref:Universal stress protein n=1 Tax=Micromonospora echinofusca TaxID=47858 RepID=A0ABS3VXE4_MICEH|nr:universal stress protein [Micromonospora echinofusca]MBO4209221.1 universal stress protein [Micromonospora echinofusca]
MTSDEILVGYDGSTDARTALGWALDEADRTHRPVRLAYAFEWLTVAGWVGPGIAPGTWPDELARRQVEELVRDAVAGAGGSHPGITVHGEVLDGPPALVLTERSASAALLVLGSRGHGGFAGLLAGSTAVSVAAHAHCPVVVVRGAAPAEGGGRAGHVVAGVDGSAGSLAALGFAFERAALRGVPLHVVRVWGRPVPEWTPTDLHLDDIAAREREALDGLLADWQRRYPQVEVTVEVPAGSPAAVLVEATRHAQLVVVGSRGHGGLRGMLLGSVSQQLIAHAYCPVAVVRQE